MDDYMKKRFGIFLLIIVGGLALPGSELIIILDIPIMWKWYFGAILIAGLALGEEYVRHLFKISKEESPPPPPIVLPPKPVLPPVQ